MRRAPWLVAGLAAGLVTASLVPPVGAGRGPVATRLVPEVVTAGEPAVLVVRVPGAGAGRRVDLELRRGRAWVVVASGQTDAEGRVQLPVDTSSPGERSLRASVPAATTRRTSRPVTLRVTRPAGCAPPTALVDPQATREARCLARRLRRWRIAGLMGVGQQLNVSNRHYLAPLTRLEGRRVAVVGFDLAELATGETYGFPRPPVRGLLELAADGAVLVATWHAPNPGTGGPVSDRSWRDLDRLLRDTPQAEAFWTAYDEVLALLARLQSGDGGALPPAAVVLRPLHEANGDWFWWGDPDPATYRRLWRSMQRRAWAAGVHNVLWAWSANARLGPWIQPPGALAPHGADLGGLDSYDPEGGREDPPDRLDLIGWDALGERYPLTALTEVGPHGSADGRWDPRLVVEVAAGLRPRPVWAMFWFDDGDGSNGVSGRKQLSSLRGGRALLDSCPLGLCSLPPR